MVKTFFLPGAGGSASFWRAAASSTKLDGVFLAWPGLGDEPPAPHVNSLEDLVSLVLERLREPANVVAQSMGGLIAIKAALAAPGSVRRLVLVATSAGAPAMKLGGVDWRLDYFRAFPRAAAWVREGHEDLSDAIKRLTIPTRLLWGDCDPISPVAVGERLLALLPNGRLRGSRRRSRSCAGSCGNCRQSHRRVSNRRWSAGWRSSCVKRDVKTRR